MADTAEQKFSFLSDALREDTFSVVSFQGIEGLSRPYAFEILLASDDLEIDLGKVLENRARMHIHRPGQADVLYNGILSTFEQQREFDGKGLYHASLVPKLWWLSITRHNQIFLDKTVREIVDSCLKDGGMTDEDYEFRLQGSYAPLEYVCQYGESHLNFLSRWIEREGIYYFFEQTAAGEKVVFTDTQVAHRDLPLGKTLSYLPPSGLDAGHKSEVIKDLNCRRRLTPAGILLKDYNYRKPSLDLTGSAVVSATGRGQVYSYNEHFRTAEEGNRLARIRAEALSCRQEEYQGESSVPFLLPGFTFDLTNHYRGGYNTKYLIVEVQHEGNQPMYLLSGLQTGSGREEAAPDYHNTFNAIKASEQFRPEQKAVKPRISGTLIAKIDAAGSGQTAELDDQGRYKVTLPFDLSGRQDGKASAWVRMAQPYTGSDHGMHFPLHKGTEVMLTFLDGDPDRPYISSTVPNPEHPSVVTAANQDHSDIKTSGGNEIDFTDESGHERILMKSPCMDSIVKLGDTYTAKKEGAVAKGFGLLSALIGYKQTGIRLGLALAGVIMPSSGLGGSVDKGVQVNTAGGLKIGATNKEENIGTGYSSTSVTGAKFSSVTGYSSTSVTGYSDESVMGQRSQLIVGANEVVIMGFKEYLALKKQELMGKLTKITAVVTKLAGKITGLFAQKTTVGEEAIEMQEMTTTMSGEKTEFDGEMTELSGKKTEMSGEETTMSGEKTEMHGKETSLSGNKTEVCVEMTELNSGKTEVSGEKTTVSSEETTLSGETNHISGMINMM